MTEHQATVPAAPVPLEDQIAQLRRWLEGYIDDNGIRRPGLVELVGKLYEELEARNERREMVGRALASGSVLAFFAFVLNWLKEHLK